MHDTNTADTLRYALAKQVPAMERGFTIQTSYGDLKIDAEDAGRIAAAVKLALTRKLNASAPLPTWFEAESLDECAQALRHTGAIFGVIDYYARGGDAEKCDLVSLCEIGIEISGRYAERADESVSEVSRG
ncbi:hypothetical protein [Burkholderia sp. D-99]|uniref:hypothetical protein n=1 Tax=Burkholderia sp. D-99 TaxID=2717316 RepID=UPI00141E8DB1|nr:hypothetical protein [Burkholderia sp. D-99]NHV27691.1 hypothetical protein [Burkholderia sp. D-99]